MNTQTLDPARFSVAPMIGCTNKHARYLYRLLSQHCLLYTEMVTTGALIYGDAAQTLSYNTDVEHPVAFQLAGADPHALAECSKMVEQAGYDEINLNVGCPSDRVQNGAFGACMMATPDLVADCVAAMRNAVNVPVTVKHRIGIDKQDPQVSVREFINTVKQSGCKNFIIHARMAWLEGLNPKENREIPPLDYDLVYQIKQEHPDCHITINGGINGFSAIDSHLEHVDGVMLGREIYSNPALLAEVDERIFNQAERSINRIEVLKKYTEYAQQQTANDVYIHHLIKPIMGLFHGQKGAKVWRRYLSEHGQRAGANCQPLEDSIALIEQYN